MPLLSLFFVNFVYCRSLTLHCDRGVSLSELLHCWLCESYWHYAAQLTTTVDRERYQECVDNALKKYFSESSLVSQNDALAF